MVVKINPISGELQLDTDKVKDLKDADVSAVNDKDLLQYQVTEGKWEPRDFDTVGGYKVKASLTTPADYLGESYNDGILQTSSPMSYNFDGTRILLGVNSGSIIHSGLGGLGSDDHTQYSLVNGTRAFTGVVDGVVPVGGNNLTTKSYVDNTLAGLSWQEPVINLGSLSDPAGPTLGDRYIIGSPSAGSWAGHNYDVTEYSTTWDFYDASEGWASYVQDANKAYVFNGSEWIQFLGGTSDHGNLAGLEDDDHLQYLLTSGGRILQGAWNTNWQNLTNVKVNSGSIININPLPISCGGTSQTTAQAAINILSNVSAATDEYVFTKDGATGSAIWKAVTTSGVGIAAGSNTQIQYNDNGALGATTDFTWDNTGTKRLRINADCDIKSISDREYAIRYDIKENQHQIAVTWVNAGSGGCHFGIVGSAYVLHDFVLRHTSAPADGVNIGLDDENPGNMYFATRYSSAGPTKLKIKILNSGGDLWLMGDDQRIYLGEGKDAEIYYNGSDVIMNSDRVGIGGFNINGCVVNGSGFLLPVSGADAEAPNNSIYYSMTQNKLVYKDMSGAVSGLY